MNQSAPFQSYRPEEGEKAFRRFEPTILAFLSSAAKGQRFLTSTLPVRSSTFCVRFRDAVRGFLRYKYPSSISPDLLARVWKTSIIRPTGAFEVYIGPKEDKVQPPFEPSTPAPSSPTSTPNTFIVHEVEQVKAIAYLAATNCTTSMSKLSIQSNHEQIREFLSTSLGDDNFARWEDENTVILI